METPAVPLHFLLIDDDDDDRELFQLALEDISRKINFSYFDDPCKALEYLKVQKEKPDYIFLDLNMPLMNGRECLVEIKNDERLSPIPVIIYSTSSDPRDKIDTSELGASGFITKPPNISELTKSIEGLLQNFENKQYIL